jgi:hypothetical protein
VPKRVAFWRAGNDSRVVSSRRRFATSNVNFYDSGIKDSECQMVYFGGPWNGKGWHILWPFENIFRQYGTLYGHFAI